MGTTTGGVEGLELDAGRELDALVAEKVMEADPIMFRGVTFGPPAYSTRIEAAWLVVEKIARRGPGNVVQVEQHALQATAHAYIDGDVFTADAETAPLAICRAALAATSRTTNPEASTGEGES